MYLTVHVAVTSAICVLVCSTVARASDLVRESSMRFSTWKKFSL